MASDHTRESADSRVFRCPQLHKSTMGDDIMLKMNYFGLLAVAALVLIVVFGVVMPVVNSLSAVLSSIAVIP